MKLEEVEYTDRYGDRRTRRERILAFPNFWDYDYYYFNAIEEAETQGKHMAVLKCRQRGYEQPYSELVATPTGFVEMGSLKIGDEVWNPDGKPTKVVEIHEQGFKDVYQLELADGRTVRCGANHLWEVICANNNFKKKVIKTHDLLTSGLFNEITVNGKKYNAYKKDDCLFQYELLTDIPVFHHYTIVIWKNPPRGLQLLVPQGFDISQTIARNFSKIGNR